VKSVMAVLERGYTLIEILIVMVIISIVAMTAVLSIHVNDNRRLSALAHEIANLISLTEEEALLRPAVLAFVPSQQGFGFVKYDNDKHQWQALLQKPLDTHVLPNDIELILKIHDKVVPVDSAPQLIFSTNGDITPFIILLGIKDKPSHYQITGESNGEIRVETTHTE